MRNQIHELSIDELDHVTGGGIAQDAVNAAVSIWNAITASPGTGPLLKLDGIAGEASDTKRLVGLSGTSV